MDTHSRSGSNRLERRLAALSKRDNEGPDHTLRANEDVIHTKGAKDGFLLDEDIAQGIGENADLSVAKSGAKTGKKINSKKIGMPYVRPDFRRYSQLPERGDSNIDGPKSFCKKMLQEIDQPRHWSQISAYNPKYTQDVYPLCPCAWPWHCWWRCRKLEQRPLFCPCACLGPCIPCCRRFPSITSPHFGYSRCPTLTYVLITFLFSHAFMQSTSGFVGTFCKVG